MVIPIDPLHSAALSLHHNHGVYALILGSGLSTAAGIPTGWEITLSLIERLASLQGVSGEPDWAVWYSKHYKKQPSYSEILDTLAATPSERRSILHSYIEPTADSDLRVPTKAHRAIAKLVADGTIRVIVTTNFDRLLENALRDAGVEPTVIASTDALLGATPLVHSRCTVIKLHGDYLDTRIRNTEDELATYPAELAALLDEVLDRFGVIVVGWSAEWDAALRDAFARAPSRRYPMYWVTRGRIAPLAEDIIAARDARVVSAPDADIFFSKLADLLDALRHASRPHPHSIAAAIALAKKYCRSDGYALEWAEYLGEEVRKIRDFVTGPDYPPNSPDVASSNRFITELVARTEVLRRSALICGRWGTPDANRTLAKAIQTVALSRTASSGYKHLISLRDLPAVLCFYWALVGATYRESYSLVRLFMDCPIMIGGNRREPGITCLPITSLDSMNWNSLAGFAQALTPASDFLFQLLRAEFGDIAIDESEVEDLFDTVEFLISLEFAYRRGLEMQTTGIWFWTPPGRYIWRKHGERRKELFEQVGQMSGEDNPLLRAGLLGGSVQTANEARTLLVNHLKSIPIW